ncbi:hypothetical protein AYL99_09747 [Fonsecaea erecta]|uniref:Uncharacterized protein n=1 Tax=Fonsecaea erecta TaxID=1367422 RepID=A0A178Z837_9EURO|nr:hypothetical protein AYL99_09747 [Fonsecaea erecta]OAP55596.1 hypothetical protein AYL99_09747 [Fonsecaea erecta]
MKGWIQVCAEKYTPWTTLTSKITAASPVGPLPTHLGLGRNNYVRRIIHPILVTPLAGVVLNIQDDRLHGLHEADTGASILALRPWITSSRLLLLVVVGASENTIALSAPPGYYKRHERIDRRRRKLIGQREETYSGNIRS